MGLEANLWKINVKKKVSVAEMEDILKKIEFQKKGNGGYELISKEGIIEIIFSSKDGIVEVLSVRECVINPPTVINLLFKKLEELKEYFDFVIFDIEEEKAVSLSELKEYEELFIKRKNKFLGNRKIEDKPISCSEVWSYIKEKIAR